MGYRKDPNYLVPNLRKFIYISNIAQFYKTKNIQNNVPSQTWGQSSSSTLATSTSSPPEYFLVKKKKIWT